jgi:hypothetical protein
MSGGARQRKHSIWELLTPALLSKGERQLFQFLCGGGIAKRRGVVTSPLPKPVDYVKPEWKK